MKPKGSPVQGELSAAWLTEGLTLPWCRQSLRLVGADFVSLASPEAGKSRSRRRTSSPHRTRLRWASAGPRFLAGPPPFTQGRLILALTVTKQDGADPHQSAPSCFIQQPFYPFDFLGWVAFPCSLRRSAVSCTACGSHGLWQSSKGMGIS